MAKKGKVLQTVLSIAGEISPTLGKSLESVTDKLDGMNGKALVVGASVAAVAGAAAAGFAKAAEYLTDLGTEYDKAANDIAASTGLVGEELAGLESVMQSVYKNNFGDSFEDVADGVSELYRMTGLVGDELQSTTEGAFALRDTFGYELTESARAAKAMMTNFGVSGEDAMSMIAAGAQNGLDYSGELIDSINEYSVQFAKLGFTADEMFQIFQEGADSGAWNLDKVGDAIKEFSIRSIDGSKTTIEAFESLGLNAEDMMATFAAGGDDASVAFQGIVAALMSVDDAVKRDEIGVKLFGTQWEDLGVEAMSALSDISVAAYDTGDALDGIKGVKYDDLDSAMQGIKRSIEVSLLPAAQSATDAFIAVAPKIEALVEKAEPVFTKIAESIGPAITAAVDFGEKGIIFLIENFDKMLPVISGVTAAFVAYKAAMAITSTISAVKKALDGMTIAQYAAATAQKALNLVMKANPIGLVVTAIGLLVAAGVALYQNWDVVKAKALELGAYLSNIWESISNAVGNMITSVGEKFPMFGAFLSGWWSSISAAVESVKGVFSGLIDFISNVFAGNWSAAWGNVASIFGNAFGAVVNFAKAPINGVISLINSAISALNGISVQIPDWVPGVGGNTFGVNLPTIPMLASGGFTDGISIAGEKATEAVISFDPAYRSNNLQYWLKAGQLLGVDYSALNLMGALNNIKELPMYAAGGFTDGVSIAGEDAMEAIISFDPAYRDENLSYWAQAGRMLGADYSDYSLDGGNGGPTSYNLGGVTFAPNITINGNADKRTIMEAIEEEYPEFIDFLEEWLAERGVPVYV